MGAQQILVCIKASVTTIEVSVDRQLRPPNNILALCKSGLCVRSITRKYMAILKPFHFCNIVPLDLIISNSILTLKPSVNSYFIEISKIPFRHLISGISFQDLPHNVKWRNLSLNPQKEYRKDLEEWMKGKGMTVFEDTPDLIRVKNAAQILNEVCYASQGY